MGRRVLWRRPRHRRYADAAARPTTLSTPIRISTVISLAALTALAPWTALSGCGPRTPAPAHARSRPRPDGVYVTFYQDGVVVRRRHHRRESSKVVHGASWRADYVAEIDPRDPDHARLRGHLTLSNRTGGALRADRVELVDRALQRASGPFASFLLRPRVEHAIRRVALPGALELPSGRGAKRALLPAGGSPVPVVVAPVFDPVGDGLDQRRRRPRAGRDFGTGRGAGAGAGHTAPQSGPLSRTLMLDPARAGLDPDRCPPGAIKVVERRGGGPPAPLGEGRGFTDPGHPVARVALGPAKGLTGRRRQTDYAYDPGGKRLVEELRIEIRNHRRRAAQVLVREHLYRGLNWALAYHNQVGAVSKDGPQAIQFRLDVPAGERREVVYRVVYTW